MPAPASYHFVNDSDPPGENCGNCGNCHFGEDMFDGMIMDANYCKRHKVDVIQACVCDDWIKGVPW